MDKNKPSAADRIIEDISENIRNGILPPDSKIAPENKLTVKYNANLYTVRKALNILKDKGILYSVPKFGVFVAQNAEQTLAVQSQNMPMRNILPDITLASRSQLAGQRAIWAEIAEKYAALPLGGRLKLHYVHGYEDVFPKADIYEYGSLSQSFLHNTNLLEVSKYFPYIIENKSAVITPCGFPFYYVAPMLIFNKNILKKLKIAQPLFFRNYDEYYIIMQIICRELWEVIICGKTLNNAMHDIFNFTQSYIHMKNKFN